MGALLITSALSAWKWEEDEEELLRAYVKDCFYRAAVLDAIQSQIEEEFEKAGIKFLVMKGSVIKHLYPKRELREMGDIDLLAYPECFKDAEETLKKLNYEVVEDIRQHEIFKAPCGTEVEVHHTMCDKATDKGMYEYFCDLSRHKLKDGKTYTYELSNEDFYVYHMAHMARHFYVKGCGIRNLVDVYIFNNAMDDNYNRAYVEEELDKLGILDFTKQMEKMSDIWLKGEESSSLYDNLFEYMLENGSYGASHNSIWNRFSKQDLTSENKRRLKNWYLFPPLSYMCEKYPVLEEHPKLLWFYWIRRFFESVFSKKKNRRDKAERLEFVQGIDETTILKMSEIYRSMNFRFK